MAYAKLDFTKSVAIDESDDMLAAVSSGVNMLGEELKNNVISLKQKDQLFKELHHRVKNNMQIMVSMLNLQIADEKDERLKRLVEDSQNRINAMALVHEMLYSSDGFQFTSLKNYIEFLSRSLFLSYGPPGHNILTKIEVAEDLFFEIDTMIPLGLIINEMISNSLKHAFPENNGLITISANRNNNSIQIVYKDDGVGLRKDFKIEDSKSLGMQLISMLGEQLNGTLQILSSNGLEYRLEFVDEKSV
jgi:two-component sensor histidine kinase